MMKLLIADDEHLVIESIKFIIEKNVPDVQIVGTAMSGREAIEKAFDVKPDIVFMDIRMPGIDGIDAIRQIKSTNRDIIFVIITAYEYFNYAKDAVNLGVHEYLLKPINKNRLVETIGHIREIISSKREAMQREILLKEKINKILPHMEGQFVYSQLLNGRGIRDIEFYEDIFGMKIQYGYVMMAIVDDFESDVKEENLKNSLIKQKFYDVFSMELKSLCPCLIGPPLLDRVVAYIPVDKNTDAYEVRNTSMEIAAKLMERVNRSIQIHYKIGVGRGYAIEYFSKSCNEAYTAASVSREAGVVHFEDIVLPSHKADTYPIHQEKILIHGMLTGDLTGVLNGFEEIFWWLSVNYKDDIDKIKSKLIELLIVLRRAIPYEMEAPPVSDENYFMDLLKIHHMEELKMSYFHYLKNMTNRIHALRERELSGLISKSLKYIHENYDQDISLDDVAKEMNMSYHYFCKFFKDAVGKNFVDYLTELRIEKSKELLKDAAVSVKEVCYKIGYSDPNYFSKIFKKVTGITPTEYRANSMSQEVI
ncbi:response regulator transcription factor [Thermotalea metallivorans]|uniref:Stage 0 sporulation protein A homolog n=1 Tax=Thermotalea metallivorans TaxID=520762 RepID=A0A140L2D3_9FIRM|nr:response regulator [Thermotalea metallivorans]KXG74708.1 HTH-type transcriptional regulator YesS [Thermotalea metallivorans]